LRFTRPAAEVSIDIPLVRALLLDQHPDLADLPLTQVDEGWDNAVFRLGDELAIRLPRRSATAALMENEQRWLPQLAPRLPLPVPAPVRLGRPGSSAGFPEGRRVLRLHSICARPRLRSVVFFEPCTSRRRLTLRAVRGEASRSTPGLCDCMSISTSSTIRSTANGFSPCGIASL